jgi:hypothetical protein
MYFFQFHDDITVFFYFTSPYDNNKDKIYYIHRNLMCEIFSAFQSTTCRTKKINNKYFLLRQSELIIALYDCLKMCYQYRR